jgi:hypothetical protein
MTQAAFMRRYILGYLQSLSNLGSLDVESRGYGRGSFSECRCYVAWEPTAELAL